MITDSPSLLGPYGKNRIGTDYLLLEEKSKRGGKHGDVFFVKTPKKTELAVKKQVNT